MGGHGDGDGAEDLRSHDETGPQDAGVPLTLQVPRFIVIGGGDVGSAYVRQLLRAIAAGRLAADRIDVIDRDPACAAASFPDPVRVRAADWGQWLDENLGRASPADHIVPYHWAPHLLLDWLQREVERAGGSSGRVGGPGPRDLPFEGNTAAGDRSLSYAAWICPPMCIEPALCPHTRGPRDWSLAADLEERREAEAFDERVVFRCLHLVYGVGTVPVADILAAREKMIGGLVRGSRRYLVATSSHCHALATGLAVAPRV